MTKALIVIGATLVAACGSSAAAPAASSPTAREVAARAEPLPASSTTRAQGPTSTIETQDEIARADAEDRRVMAELNRALELYQAFIARAGDDTVYAPAVARSKERIADIRDTLKFYEQGLKERRR